MQDSLRSQKGITLLEVMVGMLVFSLGMLLMVPMIATSIKGNEAAHDNDLVMQEVQSIVEAFKANGIPANGTEYNTEKQRYISWYTESVAANLEKLNVDVTWEDGQMQYHNRRISTYIYRKTGS